MTPLIDRKFPPRPKDVFSRSERPDVRVDYAESV
jgi:hypothetical protein